MPEAAAAITVSTTMQALTQMLFALFAVGLSAFHAASGTLTALRVPLLAGTALLSVIVMAFYRAQRRGMFANGMRLLVKVFGTHRSSTLASQAEAIDAAVHGLYGARRKLLATLVGLPPETALALSLAKRAREIALGLPGIVYLHFSERSWLRRRPVTV